MSSPDNYNFVAGDEGLKLHMLFGFNEATEAVVPFPPAVAPAPAPLRSPFLGPLEDLQGQLGWLSSPAAGPTDGLDAVNFDDFLAIDESTNDLSASSEEAPAALPSDLAGSSTPRVEPAAALDLAAGLPAVTQLEAARGEIVQLKAAMVAESHRSSSSSPRKRKLDVGEASPPKRQTTTQVGPIEALWSPKVTADEHSAAHINSASPPTPKPTSPQPDFTAPSTPPINTSNNPAISPEDLRSLQAFLNDDPAPINSAAHQVDISAPPSHDTMGRPLNMKVKRAPYKQTPRLTSKKSTGTTNKINKKPKATIKTQPKRKTSTPADIAPPPTRSINELLAAKFYSLNAQEKVRVMLPMLRSLHSKELEKSLAMLPCIQAKGAGHEVRVARAIFDSPPTPEADDILATKLTFGTKLALRRTTTTSPASVIEASPLSQKLVASVEVSEAHGAIRQRKALEKAAMLQAQGKKR